MMSAEQCTSEWAAPKSVGVPIGSYANKLLDLAMVEREPTIEERRIKRDLMKVLEVPEIAAFLRPFCGKDVPEKDFQLAIGAVCLKGEAYRRYALRVMQGDSEGGNKKVAAIMGRSPDAVEDYNEQIELTGLATFSRTRRRTTECTPIPAGQMHKILSELLWPKPVNSPVNNEPIPVNSPVEQGENRQIHRSSTVTTTFTKEGALRLKLYEAAGVAIDRSAPHILSLEEPLRWLEAGYDLDALILPVVKSRSANREAGKVKGWQYYTEAITEKAMAKQASEPSKPKKGLGRGGRKAEPTAKEKYHESTKRLSKEGAAVSAWLTRGLAANGFNSGHALHAGDDPPYFSKLFYDQVREGYEHALLWVAAFDKSNDPKIKERLQAVKNARLSGSAAG